MEKETGIYILLVAILFMLMASLGFPVIGAFEPIGNTTVVMSNNGILNREDVMRLAEFGTIKFANNPDIDINTVPEDLWDCGGTLNYSLEGGATYYISSEDNTDNEPIFIQALTVDPSDSSWNLEDTVVVLDGQNKTPILFPSGRLPVRLWRGFNLDDTEFGGMLWIYEDDTITGGIPDSVGTVRGCIDSANQQTAMSHFTVPSGYSSFILESQLSIGRSYNSLKKERELYIQVQARPYGGVFLTKGFVTLNNIGTTALQFIYDGNNLKAPEKTDIKIVVDNVVEDNTQASASYEIYLVRNELLV